MLCAVGILEYDSLRVCAIEAKHERMHGSHVVVSGSQWIEHLLVLVTLNGVRATSGKDLSSVRTASTK